MSSGLIEGTSDAGIRQETGASIGTITNNGQILGGTSGIFNLGVITTLNNAQGGNSSLIYTGELPQNYNIILGSNVNSYGKLAVTSATSWDGAGGTTTFGIYSGSVKSTKYTAVISGVTAGLLNTSTLSGTYSSGGKSYAYSLTLESGSLTVWDLLFPTYVEPVVVPIGPSVANTNQSLVNTASALQGTYTLQNSVLANSFSYDCTVFGANDVCVSAGGRNTQVQAANGLNNTSALLIAAYRPHPNYRIGAYADQNLSVSNPGGTVNLGNNTPLLGLFAAWNERLDGTGTEVKVSAAYGQKNTTITRSVVGSGDGASEAGSGSSKLNSQGAQVTAKYGFGIMDNVIVSPYVGVRYTQNNMGGYTESTSSSVTAPLTYSALNTNATTALAGVGASYRVIPTVTTFASAGIETDTNTANGTYSATNTSIGTLTPINFNPNPVKTRPTATVGAYYDIEKNQRVGITGIYRQEA
ncbi:autotransporter outer membrane beta-barrel domain-containing protein [Polynucleobacter paneuropaeus]|nr:autotransporter outer membrane beta-barrel domain-containing protein [Polynucleobacter paneuropaeus]MBT8522462.1 autotransporter outer membrane beta-barrel domain-containing protein [Polynucleobacter paneuropaeus]MBT8537997.1 autotransporter outer membrane beta-barrel domain-containing protein [Polynucleobacter paneuropaeus]